MTHQKEPRTPGGMRLRALREASGKSQFEVELDSSLGIGYLQRLELGKVQQPDRDTLERVLDAVGAHFIDRRLVLEMFGYTVRIELPTKSESAKAVEIFHSDIEQSAMPMYLLDCAHRVLAWNSLAVRLFGKLPAQENRPLMPKLIFDPLQGLGSAIVNAEDFFPAQIRILHYEYQRWGDSSWYSGFLEEMRQYKTFNQYWISPIAPIPVRPTVTLLLDTGCNIVQFRLVAETFTQDPRFRVVYYVPTNTTALRQCLDWQSQVIL